MSLLSGKSGYCFKDGLDPTGVSYNDCVCTSGANCQSGLWMSFDMNFDNITNGMISLFVLSTLEGWPDYMFQNIDAAESDTGPIKDNNPYVFYLFVFFIMIGSIFCVNLFVAIVSMNFHIAQEKNKNKNLNKEQEQWIQIVPPLCSNP